MSFGAPQWFWALLALPALVLLFVRAEQKSAQRLHDFVSPKLLPQLAGMVDRFRRALRFGLLLLGLGLAIVALTQPRWGYTFEDVKRKGIDLFVAVDTSRSMLSNDVPPSRLERVKLATQDLINELQGDRVGLIAFAGRAFVQAPLTGDYDAVVEAVRDLDTKTIPEGGTNISEAIALAERTYGKSAVGNRALIIFTDGEELSGDATKTAKAAADAGVRIFAVGVGTPEGSLIPLAGEEGGTGFVKDSKGQVVKSKLDEKRLQEIAQATGGFYLHLENGERTMRQLFGEGIAKMQAADIDVRSSRRPIERYEWPLGGAIAAITMSILLGERKRVRRTARGPQRAKILAPVTAALLISMPSLFASAPGLEAYRSGKFPDAYQQFQQTLQAHPQTKATDKLQFDAGAAAYKMKDYGKALENFSQALLSPDVGLQSKSHYNLGNTLYERGEAQKGDDKKLADWTAALPHYEETLKLRPDDKEAKENYEFVKKKIEELKNKKPPQPTPTPSPQQKKDDKQNKQDQKEQQDQQKSQQDQQQKQDQKQQDQQQQSQSQDQSGSGQKPEDKQEQAKNDQEKKDQSKAGETPSPSPGNEQPTPSPSPGEGKDDKQDRQSPSGDKQGEQSPTPGGGEGESPSPSPGKGEESGDGASPSPTPADSPQKKFAGDVKGAAGDKSEKPPEQNAEMAEAEPEKEGQMSERQAEALLRSMKDEEARVQLDERKTARRVYNDW